MWRNIILSWDLTIITRINPCIDYNTNHIIRAISVCNIDAYVPHCWEAVGDRTPPVSYRTDGSIGIHTRRAQKIGRKWAGWCGANAPSTMAISFDGHVKVPFYPARPSPSYICSGITNGYVEMP